MLPKNQMVSGLNAAQKAARKAVESTYSGICTIFERRDARDEKTKITRKNEEVPIIENQPCKLSFERLNAVVQTDAAAKQTQGTKLFIAPEIEVKPGSKIIVEQNGVTTEYFASGVPAVYLSHAEIMLKLFKGWA
ncbi:hypothetical protein AALA00_12090 [Lachnospiraceae bacterium 46-15]